MKMSLGSLDLIRCDYSWDFGHEWHCRMLSYKNSYFLDFYFGWDQYSAKYPYMHLMFGPTSFFDFYLNIGRMFVNVNLFGNCFRRLQ